MEPTALDAERYWARIGYQGPLSPTAEVLRAITRAHVLAVPFETLDGPEGRYPSLDLASIQDKVVDRRCGGACMELNGLLAHYLGEVGFEVSLFAAYVWLPHENRFTENTDHLVLKIALGDGDVLADVAFSHLTPAEPIPLRIGETEQDGWRFRITAGERGHLLERAGADLAWRPLYLFVPEPTTLPEFEQVVKQYLTPGTTTPVSRAVMCARAVPGGKITLINEYLTIAEDGEEKVHRIADPAVAERAIERIFADHSHLADRGLRLWRDFAARAVAATQPTEGE